MYIALSYQDSIETVKSLNRAAFLLKLVVLQILCHFKVLYLE